MLSEQDWVNEQLNGKPRFWDELLISGRAKIDNLEDGELKDMIETFLTIEGKIQTKLDSFGYEAS